MQNSQISNFLNFQALLKTVWPVKCSQMSIKVAKIWFHEKNESRWILYKSCLKCGQFGQNNCFHRLWKVAQSAINLVTLPGHKCQISEFFSIYFHLFKWKANLGLFFAYFCSLQANSRNKIYDKSTWKMSIQHEVLSFELMASWTWVILP